MIKGQKDQVGMPGDRTACGALTVRGIWGGGEGKRKGTGVAGGDGVVGEGVGGFEAFAVVRARIPVLR
jgi:hypothetical protein